MGQQQIVLIILGVIIVGIAIGVGLTVFVAQSVQGNKDAIVSDLNDLTAYCYQYKIRIKSLGGGDNSYVGCTLPLSLVSNDNATYTLSAASASSIVITGASTTPENGSIIATLDDAGNATIDFSSFVE